MNAAADEIGAVSQVGGWTGWYWLPDRSAWFGALRERALAWAPPERLLLELPALRARTAEAAEAHAAWLVHPCAAALLGDADLDEACDAHARWAAWVAANTAAPARAALGTLTLARDTWLWAPDGPWQAPAGTHALTTLGGQPQPPDGMAVPDPWGDSLPNTAVAGDMESLAWWMRQPLSDADEKRLTDDLRRLLGLQRLLGDTLPEAAAWMGSVTRVVVPLASPDVAEFRSGSVAGVPGLVFVEMTRRPLLVLEALVHESAHLHFHLAELGRGFIAAGHDGLYASPLRRDLRPLRGIFLAFHALLYMCAFYKDWRARTGDERAGEARQQLLAQRDAAASVLSGARSHLTPGGYAFLTACLDAARADDAR